MQIFVLILMMVVMTAGQAGQAGQPISVKLSDGWMCLLLIGPHVLLALWSWLVCTWSYRRLTVAPAKASRTLTRTDRWLNFIRWTTLAVYTGYIFDFGGLTWLTQQFNDYQLPAQLLLITLPLLVLIISWWAYYPIDRRMREAALIRNLDEGKPQCYIWSRGEYLLSQVRHQLLLILIPILMILLWIHFVGLLIGRDWIAQSMEPWVMGCGALCIFSLAPLVIRYIWDTCPMPDGEVRQTLLTLCRTHGVRVRELLLWRTYGGMINGAVMGFVGRLRYILLTDGLLEQMSPIQIEAVMAHELGHVKRHHIPWMVVCAAGIFSSLTLILDSALLGVERAAELANLNLPTWLIVDKTLNPMEQPLVLIAMLISILTWLMAFGWISRRFERQADTFAVQHLTRCYSEHADNGDNGEHRITDETAWMMASALQAVASLNHIPAGRKSWRHGAINWRCDYLKSLIGKSIDECDIDKQVRWIRWSCAVALVTSIALQSWMYDQPLL